MKLLLLYYSFSLYHVTPLAGVWIEIISKNKNVYVGIVTPLAGVWIEIRKADENTIYALVTPLAGVWIEIAIRP